MNLEVYLSSPIVIIKPEKDVLSVSKEQFYITNLQKLFHFIDNSIFFRINDNSNNSTFKKSQK